MALRLVEVAQLSDTGLVRAHNEDRAFAVAPLLAVADGMGGAKAGEVAAQMTVDALSRTGPAPSVEQIVEAIDDANREIRELSQADPDHAGMGTTVTAVLVGEDGVTALHVGDSRAYVMRGGQIRQVTEDHSLVGELVRQGQLTAEEAERHPSRNIITRALGAEVHVAVDRVPLALESGDIVLVCSDGLTTMVDADDIVRIVSGARSLRSAADALVQAAIAGGGTDNITVILGRLGDDATPGVVDEPQSHTSEIPVIGSAPRATGSQAPTARVGAPRPEPSGQGLRPVLLESHARGRRPNRTPVLVIVAAAILVLAGFGSWAVSRVFFVDARDGHSTAHIYHGLPGSFLGISLHSTWADTGVRADVIRGAEPKALSGDAHGEGKAVLQATNLIWRYGLPEIAVLELPRTTASATKKASTSTR